MKGRFLSICVRLRPSVDNFHYLSAALVALMCIGRAAAYVPETVEVGGRLQPLRWPEEVRTVWFSVNRASLMLLAGPEGDRVPLAAMEGAARAWSVGPMALRLDGPGAAVEAAYDGVNAITLADTPRNREVAGSAWAMTLTWRAYEGGQVRIVEADVVLNPSVSFAADGAADRRDLQDVLTHELGHALGLDHSPIAAATMFPYATVGQTLARSLESDDLAGLRALYGAAGGAEAGAVSGRVQTAEGAPVFGAHVAAVDASGVARVGALTGREGEFTLSALPPGVYQVYAEPLDGPVTPANFGDAFRDPRRPLARDFRTTFAGGNASPAAVPVAAGQTTPLEPIHVATGAPSLNPRFFLFSRDWEAWRTGVALPIAPGERLLMAVYGRGLGSVPDDGFRVSGEGVTIDASPILRGASSSGEPYAVLPLSAHPSALPGPRCLHVATPTERAVFSGVIEVASGA